MSRLTTMLLMISFSPTVALAQDEGDGSLQKCASISEDAIRLACFDIYAAQPDSQKAVRLDAVKSYQEKVAKVKEKQRQKDFGLSEAAIARRGAQQEAQERAEKEATKSGHKAVKSINSSDPESEPAKLTKRVPENLVTRVKEFTRNHRTKRVRILLDNGQVWQEIDGKPFRGSIKPGTEVTIAKRPLGGYKIIVSGRSASVLVRRIK